MTALSNPRHERFAQELFKGRTADAAYEAAGFKANRGNATRLKANESVQARLQELQGKQLERVEISADRVLNEIARIAFADIRKAVRWKANVVGMVEGEDGEQRLAVTNEVALIDSDKIDDDTAAAVAEISQTAQGGLKVKLHNKLGALEQLGRHLGLYDDGAPGTTVNVNVALVDRPPPETREGWIERRRRELEAPTS